MNKINIEALPSARKKEIWRVWWQQLWARADALLGRLLVASKIVWGSTLQWKRSPPRLPWPTLISWVYPWTDPTDPDMSECWIQRLQAVPSGCLRYNGYQSHEYPYEAILVDTKPYHLILTLATYTLFSRTSDAYIEPRQATSGDPQHSIATPTALPEPIDGPNPIFDWWKIPEEVLLAMQIRRNVVT